LEKRGRKWFGKCQLCGYEKTLCRAHLFPDGLKRIIADFTEIGAHVMALSVQDTKDEITQTLLFDPKILCADCDNKLGYFDDKLVGLLRDWTNLSARDHQFWFKDQILSFFLKGDYDTFVLGMLSCLLRFSYSERFDDIKLPPDIETAVKFCLEKRRISTDLEERISVRSIGYTKFLTDSGVDLSKVLLTSPKHVKLEGAEIYCFETFGLSTLFKVNNVQWPDALSRWPSPSEKLGHIEILGVKFEGSMIRMMFDEAIKNRAFIA
jgi:hypothetical protein